MKDNFFVSTFLFFYVSNWGMINCKGLQKKINIFSTLGLNLLP